MKKRLLVATAIVVLLGLAIPASASTEVNALFVCEGELVKESSGYEIIQRGVKEDDYPMDCYIDPGPILRQILAVCRRGDICIVSAKGESGNGNRHVIQKVFEVQRSRLTVGDFKRAAITPAPSNECAGILHQEQDAIRFGGGKGEDEGICVINKSEEKKVLAVCFRGSLLQGQRASR